MSCKHVGEDLKDEEYDVQCIHIGDHDLKEDVEDQRGREVLHAQDAVAGRRVEPVEDYEAGERRICNRYDVDKLVECHDVIDLVDTAQFFKYE